MGQTSNGVLEFSVSVWGLTSQWTLKDLVSQSNDHDFIMVVLANSLTKYCVTALRSTLLPISSHHRYCSCFYLPPGFAGALSTCPCDRASQDWQGSLGVGRIWAPPSVSRIVSTQNGGRHSVFNFTTCERPSAPGGEWSYRDVCNPTEKTEEGDGRLSSMAL